MMTAKRVAAALFGVVLAATGAFAFHDAGVADCAGCHTMHNSQDGALIDSTTVNHQGNAYLLKAGNASETCLSCHANYGQFRSGEGHGPGGDFYWVTKTWTWTAHNNNYSSLGDTHGHNVIAPSYGIYVDGTLGTAPGGAAPAFDSDYLSCTSCHDPHGNTNFRLLYDSSLGPIHPGTQTGRFAFANDAPLAFGNSRTTTVGATRGNETDSKHTIYKSGMSEWCGNCHRNFHDGFTTNYVHPTSYPLSQIALTYDAYQSSDQLTGGSHATSYWGLVPFENVDADTTLDPMNETTGPDQNDQVMCLTCHRAHASPFSDIARWDMGETFVYDSHPQSTDGGWTGADRDHMYYDYDDPADPGLLRGTKNQRSMCNKCHAKDFNDGPYPPPHP